jgi:hypothetical protein
MAHLHFRRTAYRRGGGKASQRLEYITRQPARELSAAARQLRYVREGREDLVYARSRNLPAWAAGNPHTYFKAAEQYERTGGVSFEEWKVTLPQAFTHRQNMALTKALVDAIAGNRLPITYAFHCPTTTDGIQPQPHLHLLISARQQDAHPRTPAHHFRRYNPERPEQGGAQKDARFYHRGAIKAHRVLISDVINAHLEQAGRPERIHPDSLKDRGIDRTPELKLLPSESRAYREQGVVSERMQDVLDIRQARAAQLPREQVQARAYWEQRKATLGLTRDLPMARKLEAITQARTHTRDYAPERVPMVMQRTTHHEQTQTQTRTLRQTPTRSVAQQLEELAARLGAEEGQAAGAALRIRLHEERGRDQGYGW